MKLVSWNCQGLGGSQKIEVIKRFKLMESISVLLVQETKKNAEDSLLTMKNLWPKEEAFVISASGASGGILTWWDNDKFTM